MPSDVAISVKAALNNFVSQKTADGEIAIDVLRSIRDEAALLMERQTIWDTFDIDPLKFFDGDDALRKQVERIKVSLKIYGGIEIPNVPVCFTRHKGR